MQRGCGGAYSRAFSLIRSAVFGGAACTTTSLTSIPPDPDASNSHSITIAPSGRHEMPSCAKDSLEVEYDERPCIM
jgi:hypothetical protein